MNNQDVQNLIKDLIEKTGVTTTTISVSEDKQNTWFGVEITEPHFFTEREGEALHALNHLVKRIIENKPTLREGSIVVDINSFQKKRVDSVRAIAHMMAERARYFKSNIEIDPMSAFERRIVHEFLADALDLKTESTGFGGMRRVVIKYTGTI